MVKISKYFSIAFVSTIIVCFIIYVANDTKKENDILMIAAIYPPNIGIEAHCFVIKKDGTMEVTKGKYDSENQIVSQPYEGVPLKLFISQKFIIETEETANVMLTQGELSELKVLMEKLASLEIQAKRGIQYGWYVTAVYYDGKLHESSYTMPPYERDSKDEIEYEDTELEGFYIEIPPPPIEEKMTNDIIDFLLLRSPIPLNEDAWWF